MNAATQQRFFDQLQREENKPAEEATNDNPAEDSTPQHSHTIYTSPTHPSTDVDSEQYALHLREQEIALQRYGNDNSAVNQVAEQLAQTNLSPEESPCGSVGEDLWKCDRCGYDSPLMHRFCGVCGGEKPEDWWCVPCQYNNSAYHRFCGLCGTSKPDNNLNHLGYEDVAGLDPEDEAAINDTVARMSHHQGQQWDEDDGYSFAEESCCNTTQAPPAQQAQPPQQQQEESNAWSCQVCTFVNENPLFMCCELCGSARPEESPPLETPPGKQQPEGRKSQRRNSNVSESSSKKKEKTHTQRIREQQMAQFKGQAGAPSASDQQQLPEPETDHELALIYAQQERILAQYQQQQQQMQQQQR